MASLEHFRRQIEHSEDLHSVVKTMKTMAAVTIRQYERIVAAVDQYRQTVAKGLHIVVNRHPEFMPYLPPGRADEIGAIVLGSEIGMCGQFNEEIAAFARDRMQRLQPDPDRRRILALGLRVTGLLEAEGQPVAEELDLPGSAHKITRTVQDLVVRVEHWRTIRQLPDIVVFYNRKESGSSYRPVEVRLWPPDLELWRRLSRRPWPSRCMPMFRTPVRELLSALIRQTIFVTLYRALAESLASENASRLAAMQAAEKNIEEHLDELRTRYNHERQSAITAELLDIVSGFEALRQ